MFIALVVFVYRRIRSGGWDSFGENLFRLDGFDAIETHNGLNLENMNQKAIHAARLRNLSSVGGSDCHNKEQVGRVFTEFRNPVHTIDELLLRA
jgi:hypothetical protein